MYNYSTGDLFGGHAPYSLEGRSWDEERPAFVKTVFDTIDELALEQLFFQRPAPHYADYRSPIDGHYQCGASTHPGGGVSRILGHNAAREILKDWKRLQKH